MASSFLSTACDQQKKAALRSAWKCLELHSRRFSTSHVFAGHELRNWKLLAIWCFRVWAVHKSVIYVRKMVIADSQDDSAHAKLRVDNKFVIRIVRATCNHELRVQIGSVSPARYSDRSEPNRYSESPQNCHPQHPNLGQNRSVCRSECLGYLCAYIRAPTRFWGEVGLKIASERVHWHTNIRTAPQKCRTLLWIWRRCATVTQVRWCNNWLFVCWKSALAKLTFLKY